MKVAIVRVDTEEQKAMCSELLESDPDLGHLDTDGMIIWAAIADSGELLGTAGMAFDEDSRHAELTFCVISTSARGRGLQKRLIRARVAWARKIGAVSLETYASLDNRASLISLLKCGFTPKCMDDSFLTVEYPLA